MESKDFYEVFPTFSKDGDLAGLLKKTKIYRIVQSRDRHLLTVYLKSEYLMMKSDIIKLQKELASQLFPDGKVQFLIHESFSLSEQYSVKMLLDEYRESIEDELWDYNAIMSRMLHKSEITIENESDVYMTLEDTVVSRSYEKELIQILEKIFNERCGVPASFFVKYVEATESKALKLANLKAQQEAQEIVKRVFGASTENELPAASEDEPFMDVSQPVLSQPLDTAGDKADMKAAGEKRSKADAAQKQRKDSGKSEKRFERKSDSGNYGSSYIRSDDPDVVYGRSFDDEAMSISDIEGEFGEVTIHGKVIFYDERPIKNEKTIVFFNITDFTDTITVKLFVKNENLKQIRGDIKVGAFLKLKGMATLDRFDHELSVSSVVGIKKIPDFTTVRMDNYPLKRVELHCHTKMSDMDAVSDVKDIIKRAKKWGMPALAITDHGVVQAFTDANHAVEKGDDFKIIYGVEGYLVDDERQMVENPAGQSFMDTFVVFDLETTGLTPGKDAIIEIGAVKVSGGRIVDRFSRFVNPQRPIPFRIVELTSIDDSMVKNADIIDNILPEFFEFIGDAALVGHNVGFDVSFIRQDGLRLGIWQEHTVLDTLELARFLVPEIGRYKLDNVAKALGISLDHHHRAVDDAECTAGIFMKLVDRMKARGINDVDELNSHEYYTPELIRKMNSYHVIILAKNEIGRVNLYKLVSDSHLKYFSRHPRIPKSELSANREGLIIGSACEAGEVFKAVIDSKPREEVARIVNFYDYLEIQPVGNNDYLRREGRVDSVEDLRDLNRQIVKLGEQFSKPVCATCDVHFLDPDDEIYRRILQAGKGFEDADMQPPLYLHTTEEMLEEFAYLGAEKAEEVVITNTNYISDMVDKIPPVRPDKCAPVIENSDQTLRDICYTKAREIYGDDLPEPVEARLERELNSIISNGFAVMYIIAQKLVWKSNEDGYLVGSRGSVGSSFVAFLAGITEVNALSPHYYCQSCHYTEFDSDEVKAFSGMAGCDMPDKICPVCGQKLNKDGFDIPFETFLGFKGDKEPDIDLNFSGDYQSKAHKYTEVIFGAGCTFKAGTVGTLAEKTAYGYVKKYYEERGSVKRPCEIDRITMGCTGVRRTTGQHPGGIIVLPHGEQIYTFTPVQHPANDMTSDIVTTHFDYHSIDHNLLKLDILGHDDPTMIRMLQDLTGVDPKTIPLDDKKVMSLFQSTDALGITPDDIGGCKLGALGIPEFGTDFAMGMLLDTKPQYLSDLVRIAGLSHGTDVWLGNAETLIKNGTATISTCICTRDDIMVYLIHMGVESSEAFSIMENVRKGKVAKGGCKQWDEWKKDMTDHGVPEWYVKSCEKIQYMFPKAHAAAYVMMAWRIAWCKIYYPLAYYAAYFSIRADGFSYELMCQGRDKLEHYMEDYRRRSDKKTGEGLSPKEENQLAVMRLVQEMYARGFEFLPIELTQADAKYFKIIDGKLMPSLASIDGVGENAADSIVEAAKHGPFLSKDDFRERAGVSKTIADLMDSLKLLGDIPESNQLSLFDGFFSGSLT